ncbi:MAG: hypothetical protein K2M17_00360 [Bacilli bacterium]|nr:hypothetical protein [Bacilli bacterium]
MAKDDKNKDTLITLLVGIVLVLSILILILTLFKGKKIDTNGDLVTELYAKLGQNDLSYCDGLSYYSDAKVDYDSLSNTNRLCNALVDLYMKEDFTVMKVDKAKKNNTCTIGDSITFATDSQEDNLCSVDRYDKEKINQKYRDIYGKDIDKYEKLYLNSTVVCYPDDDYYYCGLAENYSVTIGKEPETFRNIKEVRQKDDMIIIYDYFLKMIQDECYRSFTGDVKYDDCSMKYSNMKEVNYEFIKRYGTLYRHTFKKDENGTYYWVSSKPK